MKIIISKSVKVRKMALFMTEYKIKIDHWKTISFIMSEIHIKFRKV